MHSPRARAAPSGRGRGGAVLHSGAKMRTQGAQEVGYGQLPEQLLGDDLEPLQDLGVEDGKGRPRGAAAHDGVARGEACIGIAQESGQIIG